MNPKEFTFKKWLLPLIYLGGVLVVLLDRSVSSQVAVYLLHILLLCLALGTKPLRHLYPFLFSSGMVLLGLQVSAADWQYDLINRVICIVALSFIYYIFSRKKGRKVEDELLQRLEAKEKQLSHFAYVASHDLNEPLRTLTSFTAILNEEHADEFQGDTKTYFRFINEAALKMKELINGLLEYSRLGRSSSVQKIDLNKTLDRISTKLGVEIEQNSYPKIKGMPLETEILFENLIDNASKFRKENQDFKVEVKVEDRIDGWEFHVIDNGIGLEEKDKVKIFDMFTKLHGSRTYDGLGLGLALCQRIVELHGGKIEALSNKSGGVTIKFNYKE